MRTRADLIYGLLSAMRAVERAVSFPWAVTTALVRMTCTRRYDAPLPPPP